MFYREDCNILRTSLVLGYIARAWRNIRVSFKTKPEKIGLGPTNLMSFVPNTAR